MERDIKKSAGEFIDTLAKGHEENRLRNSTAILIAMLLIIGGINQMIHSDTASGIALVTIGVLIASYVAYDAYVTGTGIKKGIK